MGSEQVQRRGFSCFQIVIWLALNTEELTDLAMVVKIL